MNRGVLHSATIMLFVLRCSSMPIISIQNISKRYASGHQALTNCSIDIEQGEILALLGANGAGKTTLISIICGIVNATSGTVLVNDFDIVADYRKARSLIGLVPQELTLPVFDTVMSTVEYSRGLFGKPADPKYLEQLLHDLSLWDKKDSEIRRLSGGMKRRVLIAKALSHTPKIIFLDEPTAGVDVELRKDMWRIVQKLRKGGTTIILTTHYLEEAEALADRIGIIREGELLLLEQKTTLLKRLGSQQVHFTLAQPMNTIPETLLPFGIKRTDDGLGLIYGYTEDGTHTLQQILTTVIQAGLVVDKIDSHTTSLEDIFVSLTSHNR